MDGLVHSELVNLNDSLGKKLKGDCVFLNSSMMPPLDDTFRVALEEIKARHEPNQSVQSHLIVMLQTMGGFMETVERLVAVMRTHYDQVSLCDSQFCLFGWHCSISIR